MLELWVSFWTWLYGGAIGAYLPMLIMTGLVAACFMLVPLWFLSWYTGHKDPESGNWVVHKRRMPVFIFIPMIFVIFSGFFVSMYVGIEGSSQYRAQFRECYQTVVTADGYEIYETFCRERTNIADDWTDYEKVHASLHQSPYLELR